MKRNFELERVLENLEANLKTIADKINKVCPILNSTQWEFISSGIKNPLYDAKEYVHGILSIVANPCVGREYSLIIQAINWFVNPDISIANKNAKEAEKRLSIEKILATYKRTEDIILSSDIEGCFKQYADFIKTPKETLSEEEKKSINKYNFVMTEITNVLDDFGEFYKIYNPNNIIPGKPVNKNVA